MGWLGRKSKKDKNPQSGANSFSSSSAQSHGSSHSDVNVPTVDLAEQRLRNWSAVPPGGNPGAGGGGGAARGQSGIVNGGGGKSPIASPVSSPVPSPESRGARGASGSTNVAGGKSWKNSASPPRNYSTSPNSLILLIERGQWAAATQRAVTHEAEVKQLVKLRKTTKNAPPPMSSSNTGAEVAASPGGGMIAPGLPGGIGGVEGGSRTKRNLQISNVKCKALHHACQKLRSVHTTIYSNKNIDAITAGSGAGNNRRIIEEDEYIEACKCILTLIRIHPEACKDRESRHGCLPLHLCVFSMCATPPPPLQMADTKKKGHTKVRSEPIVPGRSDQGNVSQSDRKRPPAPPGTLGRSSSVPNAKGNSAGLHNLPGHKGHRSIPSSSSADFSLGNISEMIREESEHQKVLADHKEQSGKSATEKIYEGIENMEKMLVGLESKYEMEEEKKKRDKNSRKRSSGIGSAKFGIKGSPKGGRKGGRKESMDSSNSILNNSAPLEKLEERSRETDSHSTPAQAKDGKVAADERTGAAISFASDTPKHGNHSNNSSISISHTMSTMSLGLYKGSDIETAVPVNKNQPTYEDLQRRYLQINTQRRDDYSVRVLNALLDAWPKSVKTSSEGGRLPLHMACFGKATVRVMEAVLNAYPDAARQRNHDGFLPIHIAAHWGVSHADIAPLILRAYPDGAVGRNRWERTPIEEALGMAGENGRDHQLSLVWSLRRHPTYWIHNDIGTMLLPRNVRTAPWRLVDVGDALTEAEGGGTCGSVSIGSMERRVISRSAVDVDEVGTSDEEDEGVEVQMTPSSLTSGPNTDDPEYIRALAESTDLSLLITKDKHWAAAAFRCRLFPHEACEAMEVKVRGAYTAKITPLHYACENRPTVEVIQTLIEANEPALERRQEPGGQLPLHAACTWGATPDVVRALLVARPSCAEMKDFLSNLPLHCACYSGADTEVLEALLRVYPQSVWPRNHQGSSAVDIVRRLSHPNRREVLGLLEKTMGRLLERAAAAEGGEDQDNSLEWV